MPNFEQLINKAISNALKETTIELHQEIIDGSPNWTGWYRYNHHVTEGGPSTEPDPESRPREKGSLAKPAEMNSSVFRNDDIEAQYYLSNPVPYAEYIENGGKNRQGLKLYANAQQNRRPSVFRSHLKRELKEVRSKYPELAWMFDEWVRGAG